MHVSCGEALEPIVRARGAGLAGLGRDLPAVPALDASALETESFEAAKYVFTPPPRARHNQELLWAACARELLSVISTDHCAFLWQGQKTLGLDDFSKIPNGAPGSRRGSR